MAATERLTIEMRAQDRASAGIRKVKGELGGLKAKGQEAAAGLSRAFGALGIAFGGAALLAGLKKTVGEFAKAESVSTKLEAALGRVGRASAGATAAIEAFASAQQDKTRFDDDAVKASITTLIQLTGSYGQQTLAAARAAQDFAEGAQMPLASASRMVAVAIAGNIGALSRYLPALKDVDAETFRALDVNQRTAIVVEALGKAFGGASESISAAELAMARYENATGNFQEALGRLVSSQLFVDAINGATILARELEDLITPTRAAVVELSRIDEAQRRLAGTFVAATPDAFGFQKEVRALTAYLRGESAPAIRDESLHAAFLAGAFNETGTKAKAVKQSIVELTEAMEQAAMARARLTGSPGAIPGVEIPAAPAGIDAEKLARDIQVEGLLSAADIAIDADARRAESATMASESVIRSLEQTAQAQQAAGQASELFAAGVGASMIQSAVAAAVAADSMEDFGKAFLGIVGQNLVALGGAMIASGLAASVLGPSAALFGLSTPQLLGAGAGLVAAGTALSAVGGGGEEKPAAGGGGGGAPAFGAAGETGATFRAGEPGGSQVVIVFGGDRLHTDESIARRVEEVLSRGSTYGISGESRFRSQQGRGRR